MVTRKRRVREPFIIPIHSIYRNAKLYGHYLVTGVTLHHPPPSFTPKLIDPFRPFLTSYRNPTAVRSTRVRHGRSPDRVRHWFLVSGIGVGGESSIALRDTQRRQARAVMWSLGEFVEGVGNPRSKKWRYVALLRSTPQSISFSAAQIDSKETTIHGLPLSSEIVELVFLSTRLPLSVICLPRLLPTSPTAHNARIELCRFRVFFIGHEPASLVRSQVQTDSDGYILTERGSRA